MQAHEYVEPRPGYHRDGDAWYYVVASTGDTYYVSGPDVAEPIWRRTVDPEAESLLPPDAEPGTPHPEDLEQFERARIGYGIAD